MRHLFYVLIVAILLSAASFAQQPQATPPPQPPPQQPPPAPQPQAVRIVRSPRANNPFERSSVSESESHRLATRVTLLHIFVNPLYRKPTNREMAALAPSSRVLDQYSAFLKTPNTGVFRLVPDVGCAASDKVINVSEECLKFTMPGAGNSFSFRAESHKIRHLADIMLVGDKLKITGIFMHAMMANVGEAQVEKVSLNSPGINFLSSFKPSTNSDHVAEIDTILLRGVEHNGFRYAKELAVKENSTYVFRAVAYRGKVMRSARGVAYNELEYDKREDITVAFRIVERGSDGSVTIVWKQLSDLESPKIRMPKMKPQVEDESNQ